ncbi:MAG: ABC transporter ATP-binding protein [Planctomycetes bacterium]|nr:ABC transporter ATP-binding protein [Planctomycetota bacterium]
MTALLLRVRDLRTCFRRDCRAAWAVDGVSFDVAEGETLALVGESGCGKTVTALSILRLVEPPGSIEGGEVLLRGRDLLRLPERALRSVRGAEISMVFQDPMTSLDPVQTAGRQVAEALRAHRRLPRRAARLEAVGLLERVGIPDPELRARAYPHQLSGGLRQRVMIAMAVACAPRLIIADEPTTALDATVQAQIVSLLRDLQRTSGMSILVITHDMGLVAELADRVAVMYAGKVVESGPAGALFDEPRHPYTAGLFDSMARLHAPGEALRVIPGDVPDPFAFPSGCRFHPRGPLAAPACAAGGAPPLAEAASGHLSACLRLEGGRIPGRPPRPGGGRAA